MAEPEAVTVTPLPPTDMQYGVHAYQQLSITPKAGTPIEHLERPEYWSFVVDKVIEGAEIRILPEDMAYRAEALVTFCDKKNIRVKIFNVTEFVKNDVDLKIVSPESNKDYNLTLRGPNKWCIQRVKDGEWIKERIPTKNEAEVYLEKYLLSLDGDAAAMEWLAGLDY